METVNVIIGTFGRQDWWEKGKRLAISTYDIQGHDVIHYHGNTLAEARNLGAAQSDAEWLCFLDADDALEEDYLNILLAGEGDLRVPRLMFVEGHKEPYEPFDLTKRDMNAGNPCPIGTLIRKEMFMDVGGFQEYPAWEDWAMFQRAWMLGADVVHHDAIYFASYRDESRNNTVENPNELFKQIISDNKKWLRKVNNAL